jgi:4-carboxymuconolactone decarboxylase
MPRLPFATRNDVAETERAAYDAFVEKRGGAPQSGPYALLLHLPEVAQRVEALRLCLREDASIAQPVQELVMLTVAREMDCAYIWYAHAAAARVVGLRGDIVDDLREKREPARLSAGERAALDYTRELLRHRRVTAQTFERASSAFGRRGTMTLTTLIGCYATLAWFMNAYELESPVDPKEKPLPV